MSVRDEIVAFLLLMGIAFLSFGMFAGMARGNTGNYERSIGNVLVHEGGAHYTNHPADPGGPTKYGITIHDLRLYYGRDKTAADVMNMTEEVAREIYWNHYAKPLHFGELPRGVDYVLLDYGVNAGTARAMGDLSRILKVPFSQQMTSDIVTALRVLPPSEVIQRLSNRRLEFQMGLASRFDVFKRGWRNRINSVNTIALSMAGARQSKAMNDGTFDMIPRIGAGKAYIEENPNGI